jgi:hypothetical protein
VPEAVLLTGVFGSGKTAVVEEMSSILEEAGVPYAAVDLDWLCWFDAGWDDDTRHHELLLRNLEFVAGNYRAAGIRFFLLARSIEARAEVDSIAAVLAMPLTVVRLTAPTETIRERFRSDTTTARKIDLRWAEVWIEEGRGEGLEDFQIANDRPIRQVAVDVLARLRWLTGS